MLLKIKIEIDLPEEEYNFFKARAIIKGTEINEEISHFLKTEAKTLRELSFKEAIY